MVMANQLELISVYACCSTRVDSEFHGRRGQCPIWPDTSLFAIPSTPLLFATFHCLNTKGFVYRACSKEHRPGTLPRHRQSPQPLREGAVCTPVRVAVYLESSIRKNR